MNMSAITKAAQQIVDVKKRLSGYVRDANKAKIVLIEITKNKKKKGRTLGAYKDSDITGGFNCRWSAIELTILLYSLIFTNIYGAALRFDFNTSPVSSGNVNVIRRVMSELIQQEELDILFVAEIKGRSGKSIKDKLAICCDYDGEDNNSTTAKIQRVMNEKFHYQMHKRKKEPSSGL